MLLKNIIQEETKNTNGILVYQEQFMRILITSGYTTKESDIIRKNICKRKVDEIKKLKDDLLEKYGQESEGCIEYLLSKLQYAVCEGYYREFEKGANAFLEAITDEFDKIKYPSHLSMIANLLLDNDEAYKFDDIEYILSRVSAKYGLALPKLNNRVKKILEESNIDNSTSLQLLGVENNK